MYVTFIRVSILLLGPLWPWSYVSWIYNYLCNLCLSPLMLLVRIPLYKVIEYLKVSHCRMILFHMGGGGGRSWSYGSWICKLPMQLVPITTEVVSFQIPLRRGVLNTTLYDKVCLICGRSVVFSRYSGFLQQWN